MKKSMKKKQKNHLPKTLKIILIISLIFYLWFFISSLLIPISKFLPISEVFILTIQKMLSFPVSLLSFILCVSTISSIIILMQFQEQKYSIKLLLIETTSLILYYAIPIIATLLVLLFITLRLINYIPSAEQISFFLNDLFIFTTFLFSLTAILNIAMQRLVR